MSPQKEIKTTDKSPSKKNLGNLQADNPKALWEHLLYLSAERTYRKQLAHWAHVGKGKSRCISKIRSKSAPATVLQLQHKSRRSGGRFLQKNVGGNRESGDGKARKG